MLDILLQLVAFFAFCIEVVPIFFFFFFFCFVLFCFMSYMLWSPIRSYSSVATQLHALTHAVITAYGLQQKEDVQVLNVLPQ